MRGLIVMIDGVVEDLLDIQDLLNLGKLRVAKRNLAFLIDELQRSSREVIVRDWHEEDGFMVKHTRMNKLECEKE